MKIEILDVDDPVSGDPYVLFEGAYESPGDPFEPSHEDSIQIAPGLRATAVRVFSRGNTAFSLPLEITRTYASVLLAELALLDHPGEVPRAGIIRITPEGSSGDERYLRNATIHRFAARQIGLSITWRYLITGGEISDEAPS